MSIDRELCILALLYKNTTFCATFIKLYLTLIAQIEGIKVKLVSEANKELASKLVNNELAPLLVKHSKGYPCKNLEIIIFLQDNAQF